MLNAVLNPEGITTLGLASSRFARRYFGNLFWFLFLRLLRCFSSAGSLHIPMYSVYGDWGMLSRVSPFRNQRVKGYLLLTAAYRSLSRPSSALSAKASTLRPFLLNLPLHRSVLVSRPSVMWSLETAQLSLFCSLPYFRMFKVSKWYLMSC